MTTLARDSESWSPRGRTEAGAQSARRAERAERAERDDGWGRPEKPGSVEVAPGGLARSAADRLAALTARGAGAASAMIHLIEGPHMRLIGGYQLPSGFLPMQQVPMSLTLAGVVMHVRYPLVIPDLANDSRVPTDAPARTVGLRA